MNKIPSFLNKYLWDVKIDSLDLDENYAFVIERVLEYGDIDSFRWLIKNINKNKIVEVLKSSKKISPKTGNFFSLYFDINKKEVLCIQKPFIRKQERF